MANIALNITINRSARDMSVAIHDSESFMVPVNELAGGKPVPHPKQNGLLLEIISVSPEKIVAKWHDEILTVNFGESVSSKEEGSCNPYLSFEGFSATLEYADFSDFEHTVKIIREVGDYHQRLQAIGEFALPDRIVEKQRQARQNISQLCVGDVSRYPLNALLAASDNWTTFEIVRLEQFKKILLKGIGKGCLLHDVDYAWQIMEVAATNNDPAEFMDDMERYYDILATAAENGNTIALDIMNRIWEPEQIIEED